MGMLGDIRLPEEDSRTKVCPFGHWRAPGSEAGACAVSPVCVVLSPPLWSPGGAAGSETWLAGDPFIPDGGNVEEHSLPELITDVGDTSQSSTVEG